MRNANIPSVDIVIGAHLEHIQLPQLPCIPLGWAHINQFATNKTWCSMANERDNNRLAQALNNFHSLAKTSALRTTEFPFGSTDFYRWLICIYPLHAANSQHPSVFHLLNSFLFFSSPHSLCAEQRSTATCIRGNRLHYAGRR